jgi:dinuclear metal center YbgI/SA1388 family protein
MKPTVADIIRIIEDFAPRELAEDWDNCGLQVGSLKWPVKRLWVALDPTPEVIQAACQQKADLLVTHHPLIFKPLKSIDFSHPLGRSIQLAAKNHLAVFSAHTNLDKTDSGLNDMLAEKLGLTHIADYHQREGEAGFGRIGELTSPCSLRSLANAVKKALAIETVRVAGDLKLRVHRVLVCSGSGSGLLGDFLRSDAQVYLSGDMRYHDALEIQQARRGMIDIGHFASEHIMVEALTDRLSTELEDIGAAVEVVAYEHEKDPFILI